MSIISTIFVPEGIAMAADSRITITIPQQNGNTNSFALSDSSQKLFMLHKVKIGISYCGSSIIDNKTIGDFIRIFEINEVNENDTVEDTANKLCEYTKKFTNNLIIYHICGYNRDEPFVYRIVGENISRCNTYNDGKIAYDILWNGELEAINNLINGNIKPEIVFDFIPLKDAIDFVDFLVDTTIKYQRFQSKLATCGGPIDLLVITKDDIQFIRHKIYKP